jgi:phage gp36-like protein
MTAFASGSDFIARYDYRTIADLINDDGTAATQAAITGGANSVVNAALEDASGEILSALQQAGRYTEAGLLAMTGNQLALLKKITCKIAFWNLWERRASWDDDRGDQARSDARRIINDLKNGNIVFGIASDIAAGNPRVSVPTIFESQNRNTLRYRCSPIYPREQFPRS